MNKHHSYFRNGREIDASEALDRNGCLRDGVSTRISMQSRDARMTDLQRAVAADAANRRPSIDAFGAPAGHRPGFAFINDRAGREAKEPAYAEGRRDTGKSGSNQSPWQKGSSDGRWEHDGAMAGMRKSTRCSIPRCRCRRRSRCRVSANPHHRESVPRPDATRCATITLTWPPSMPPTTAS